MKPSSRPGRARPILLTILVLIVAFVVWIGIEVYFAITARPNVDTDYASQMEALSAGVQGDGPNRWSEFAALLADQKALTNRLALEVGELEPRESRVPLGYASVYDEASLIEEIESNEDLSESEGEAELARLAAGRELYAAALDSWDESGLLGRLRELRGSGAVFVRPIPRKGMLIEMLLPELGDARRLAQALRARATLAGERGDWEEYLASVADGFWLAETVEAEPILIGGLVGIAIRSLMLEGVRQDVLTRRLPAETLSGLAELLETIRQPDAQHPFRGELLWSLDAVQHTHDKRGRLMLSRMSTIEGFGASGPPIMNLGSIAMPRRETTERVFTEYYEGMIGLSLLTPAERRSAETGIEELEEAIPANQFMLGVMAPAFGSAMQAYDISRTDHIGLRTLIAIERYRAERGELPAALGDLVPDSLSAAPPDPWAGEGPLRFERDESELGYRLYSVGSDGEDNDGKRPEPGRYDIPDQDALNGDAPGTDYVFTR